MLTMKSYCWLCHLPLALPATGICSCCQRRLPCLPALCLRCGLPAAPGTAECGRCLQKPPPWQHLVCAGDYQPPLSRLLHKFKFSGHTALSVMLARLILLSWLKQHRENGLHKPDILLCSPLHKQRLRQRGFNQSALLAQPLARWLGCEFSPEALQRIRKTAVQHQLNISQRKQNLHNAFCLEKSLAGRHVALVDDVVTSGSTAGEISRLLTQSAVADIQVWCLCRTL
ncbi:DNA utilization protein GntX [Tatumella citrea]|uniref:Phosphoribosyltransferase n=1 Tax=Tatumella citrea TaxID=53336 RepID=A0A1Y0L3T7_TATCI|nr:DNA utilization protein GntX [Tatumella citrea]ARU92368.1 phosphoribosyltransferase [Tatumella citrea]ARU96403.1 phosphoribosyltransferase [Tatumella citrea]